MIRSQRPDGFRATVDVHIAPDGTAMVTIPTRRLPRHVVDGFLAEGQRRVLALRGRIAEKSADLDSLRKYRSADAKLSHAKAEAERLQGRIVKAKEALQALLDDDQDDVTAAMHKLHKECALAQEQLDGLRVTTLDLQRLVSERAYALLGEVQQLSLAEVVAERSALEAERRDDFGPDVTFRELCTRVIPASVCYGSIGAGHFSEHVAEATVVQLIGGPLPVRPERVVPKEDKKSPLYGVIAPHGPAAPPDYPPPSKPPVRRPREVAPSFPPGVNPFSLAPSMHKTGFEIPQERGPAASHPPTVSVRGEDGEWHPLDATTEATS
jgi:hypothetical protein